MYTFIILSFLLSLSTSQEIDDPNLPCFDNGLHTIEQFDFLSDKISCLQSIGDLYSLCDNPLLKPTNVTCIRIGSSIRYNSTDHISETVLNVDWTCLDNIKPWLDGIRLRCGKATDACRTTRDMCYINYDPLITVYDILVTISLFMTFFFCIGMCIFTCYGTHCFLLFETSNLSRLEQGKVPCLPRFKRSHYYQ